MNMDKAYNAAISSSHGINGYFTSFYTAATVIRLAYELNELDVSILSCPSSSDNDYNDNDKNGISIIKDFFKLVDSVEKDLQIKQQKQQNNKNNSKDPFIVVVEGLDGSGKSSLVEALATHFQQKSNPCHENDDDDNNDKNVDNTKIIAMACSTPTKSMSNVRPVFDKRGGVVARAFYMVSNYVLAYEIQKFNQQCYQQYSNLQHNDVQPIFIVDRWFSSTCAYSIAWKNTKGGIDSIDGLDESLFYWPNDLLLQPTVTILLQVDDDVRKKRVESRNSQELEEEQSNMSSSSSEKKKQDYNPWDTRLSNDFELGKRIMRCHERLILNPSNAKVNVDANASQSKVRNDAIAIVESYREQHFEESVSSSSWWLKNVMEYQNKNPMEFMIFSSSKWNLCNVVSSTSTSTSKNSESSSIGCEKKIGRRKKHASWAMQLSLVCEQNSFSNLRSVGIHSVDNAGILFFTWGHPGGGYGTGTQIQKDIITTASMCSIIGEYPQEQQWRAEGFLVPLNEKECNLLDVVPPPSLESQVRKCAMREKGYDNESDEKELIYQRRSATTVEASGGKEYDSTKESLLQCTRFVPQRIEVLIGGPSSPGGPRRFEWERNNGGSYSSSSCDWNPMREINAFSPPNKIAVPRRPIGLRNITLAIMGTHCSGKRTIGSNVADIMGWRFDPELGDVLRDSDMLVSDGHITGDGSGTGAFGDWDSLVYSEERKRDEQANLCRVVETWHVGNLAWALQRNESTVANTNELQKELRETTQKAIVDELSKNVAVLFVYLDVTPETMVTRRNKDQENKTRLPMNDEFTECKRLHQVLGMEGISIMNDLKHLNIPILKVQNNLTGPDAICEITRSVISFIAENQWRRLIFPEN